MVLVDSMGDLGVSIGALVLSAESHCGGVIMDAMGVELELLDDM